MPNFLLQRFANTRAALFARHLLGLRPPDYIPNYLEVVSDLFLWRCDEDWETFFDLAHLAGLLNPEARSTYKASIVLYSKSGDEIGRYPFDLSFSRTSLVCINDLLSASAHGHGTFVVMHWAATTSIFGAETTCLAERGYVSYRRRSDSSPLRSYVHGNLYGMGGQPITGKLRLISLPCRRPRQYQPQIRLNDCQYAEIAVVNYTSRAMRVEAVAIAESGTAGNRVEVRLPSRASVLIDTRSLPMSRVCLRAPTPMPRPLLFKYHASHFDVLHG